MMNEKLAYLRERLDLRKDVLNAQKNIVQMCALITVVKLALDIWLYIEDKVNYLNGFSSGLLLMSILHLTVNYRNLKSDIKLDEMEILALEGFKDESVNDTK